MAIRSLVAGLVIAVLALVGATRASSTTSIAPVQAPCDPASLTAPFHGQLAITTVSAYACEDGWAYFWANAGTGVQEVSVTELAQFSTSAQAWEVGDRASACAGTALPSAIKQGACYSN